MSKALVQARAAANRGEVPVGAVIVDGAGKVIALAAISNARIGRLYYGASDPKSGGVEQGPRVFSHAQCHHAPEVYDGIDAVASQKLLRDFFKERR